MKVEYDQHSTGEKCIEIQWMREDDKVWITESHVFDIEECWNESRQLQSSDWDSTGEYVKDQMLELKGYRQELEKEEEIGIDKYLAYEILENHLKKTYPNEEIEII